MKKSKIKVRSIVYSLVSVAIALAVVLILLSQIPIITPVRSELQSFPGGKIIEKNDEMPSEATEEAIPVQVGIDMNGHILGDNSYHVGEAEIKGYIDRGIFRYGRWNPMLYKTHESIAVPDVKTEETLPVTPVEPKSSGIDINPPQGDLTLEHTNQIDN